MGRGTRVRSSFMVVVLGCLVGLPLGAGAAVAAVERAPAATAAQLATGSWAAVPAGPLSRRVGAFTAWTGSVFLVIGGSSGTSSVVLRDGAAFDPATRRWRLLGPVPAAVKAVGALTWTGRVVLAAVAGGAAALDPASGRWTVVPAAPLGGAVPSVAVTDAAGRAVVLGSLAGSVPSRAVATFDPVRRAWRALPPLPAVPGHTLTAVYAVTDGPRVDVFAGWTHTLSRNSFEGGTDTFALDPAAGRWARLVHPDVLLGSTLATVDGHTVVAGGTTCPPVGLCPFPSVTPFSVRGVPGAPSPPVNERVGTGTGASFVVVSGVAITGSMVDERPGDAAAYDPATRTWRALPSARGLLGDPEALAWTGHELLLWGDRGLLALAPRG